MTLGRTTDVLVVGGGIVGLTVALAIRARHPSTRIELVEKESRWGAHASGRNSGVLHAGFYYSADSLKARFSREGAAALARWCEERGLPLRRCGKLVVARSEADHAGLDELLRRARSNGVPLDEVDEQSARRIEPRVRTVGRALWSPSSASVDPLAVVSSMAGACADQGIGVHLGVAWRGMKGRITTTSAGPVEAGLVVNCAGLQADRVARAYGASTHLRILPFKGRYLLGGEGAEPLRCHVYPVPDLAMPFLGAHLTVTPTGGVKIGPTAVPALWREHYEGLDGLRAGELVEVLGREAWLLCRNQAIRRHAWRELRALGRSHLLQQASTLVDGIDTRHFRRWGRPGIRAQLVDMRTGELVMDFCVERGERSLHVLNAISPAFTCSLPFAAYVAEQVG